GPRGRAEAGAWAHGGYTVTLRTAGGRLLARRTVAPVPRSPYARVRPSEGPFRLPPDSEDVTHQADVGDLEERRVRVLVDGHDGAGVLDAGQVLERAGNADGHVLLRGDDLAGLADLHLVRAVAGVHRRARGAHRRAELVGQRVDVAEV